MLTMRQLKISKSITNRESASLEKYLQEIGHQDLLTADERGNWLNKSKRVTAKHLRD